MRKRVLKPLLVTVKACTKNLETRGKVCGILGKVGRNGKALPSKKLFRQALGLLKHRGPDDEGIFVDHERIILGHRRLSVIDIEGGAQPMTSEDGRYTVAFNGEIYNFLGLRRELEARGYVFRTRSDTEVALYLYAEYGDGFVEKLLGMFAIALYDRDKNRVILARDRVGKKPMYYHESESGVLFGSEINALLAVGNISRSLDYDALQLYLTFQYIPAPYSAFSAIRKVKPAHFMLIDDGKIKREVQYWNPHFQPKEDMDFETAAEQLRELFLDAVRLRTISDVPLGAFLSGGVDSSLIVAALAEVLPEVKTFSIGFDDKTFNELPYAEKIAQQFGTVHTEAVLDASDISVLDDLILKMGEPFGDQSIVPTYYVCRLARQKVTVALTGDGGDENFGGYKRYYNVLLSEKIRHNRMVPFWILLRKLSLFFERLLNRKRRYCYFPNTKMDEALRLTGPEQYIKMLEYFSESQRRKLVTKGNFILPIDYLRGFYDRNRTTEVLDNMIYSDLFIYLGGLMAKTDIASMAVSLECRCPLLDHRIIEFAASMPSHYKMAGRQSKRILKYCMRKAVDPVFFDREKKGFSAPIRKWMGRSRADSKIAQEIEKHDSVGTLFNREAVNTLLDDHFAGRRDNWSRIWLLYIFVMWASAFRVNL
ncbi:MAG: asparagine synthase (glutamine-hydrolyzing) [Deltaproteobacteria bacterium]|nr:asparagine synthase (glutamine-hydrolyzing) [Deltaproteobacteria bacterium]